MIIIILYVEPKPKAIEIGEIFKKDTEFMQKKIFRSLIKEKNRKRKM